MERKTWYHCIPTICEITAWGWAWWMGTGWSAPTTRGWGTRRSRTRPGRRSLESRTSLWCADINIFITAGWRIKQPEKLHSGSWRINWKEVWIDFLYFKYLSRLISVSAAESHSSLSSSPSSEWDIMDKERVGEKEVQGKPVMAVTENQNDDGYTKLEVEK